VAKLCGMVNQSQTKPPRIFPIHFATLLAICVDKCQEIEAITRPKAKGGGHFGWKKYQTERKR